MNTIITRVLAEAHTIETPRMYLRLLTPELWSAFMKQATDDEMKSVLALTTPEALKLEKTKHRHGITTYRTSFRYFLLVDKDSGITIGKAAFHNWQAGHNRSEIGYSMDIETFRRKGLMTEAIKAMIHYGFEEMGLHRVEAFASPDNVPSVRLLEGLGFTREGLLRQHYNNNGIRYDSACFGLLKPEYEQAKANW